MAKIIINLMLFLSGVFAFLAIVEATDCKRRKKTIAERNKQFDEMIKLVNSTL